MQRRRPGPVVHRAARPLGSWQTTTTLDLAPDHGRGTGGEGLGVRTAIKIPTIVGDASAFPTAGHLAAYAGLAPVTRRSGTSIKGETRSQRGNHALKNALFLSAFASLADPTSRAYYDRKLDLASLVGESSVI